MRILYLTLGCFDKGGISRYCRYQIKALREIVGAKNIYVLSLRGSNGDSFEQRFDINYFAGSTDLRGKSLFACEAFKQALIWRPDVILSSHINLSSLARLLAVLCHGKVVENIYGLEVWSHKRKDAAWGLKKSNFVISDCHYTANYAAENQLTNGKIEVIWDCVDIDRFFPAKFKQNVLAKYGIPNPDYGINLLTLGRMTLRDSYKGYERLFDVCRHISDRAPNLRLIYAGQGDLAESLKSKTKQLGLSDRVFFTGSVEECDLADVYRAAHIFSLLSDRGEGRGEGIPLTPLEASACGLPILVGNQDGSQEAVMDGHNGFVVDPFDLELHGKVIMTLVNNSTKRREMGIRGVERIRDVFSYSMFKDKHHVALKQWFPSIAML